jgi:hypothetical protein
METDKRPQILQIKRIRDMKQDTDIQAKQQGEIILYQPDETVRLEVRLEDDTVWLTQQQMAELFLTTKQNVSLHVNNIFREDELQETLVVKESLTTAKDGKRYRMKLYNLERYEQKKTLYSNF